MGTAPIGVSLDLGVHLTSELSLKMYDPIVPNVRYFFIQRRSASGPCTLEYDLIGFQLHSFSANCYHLI